MDVSNLATASSIRVCQDSNFLETSEIRLLLHRLISKHSILGMLSGSKL